METDNKSTIYYFMKFGIGAPKSKQNSFLYSHGAGIVFSTPDYYNSQIMTDAIFEYVISGKGHIKYKGQHITVNAGDCIVFNTINSGEHLTYYSDNNEPYTKLWFSICGDFVNAFKSIYPEMSEITVKKINLLNEFISIVLSLKNNNGLIDLKTVPSKIMEIMNYMYFDLTKESHHNTSELGELIAIYTDINISSDLKIEKISSFFGMTSEVFSKYVKDYFKCTYHQYVLERKFTLAKKYLSKKNLSITEIAEKLGFSNQGHFSSFFKKKSGMYPREYILSIKENTCI